jgi:RNA polymerase sigma-70 factor (ECF subfamily)
MMLAFAMESAAPGGMAMRHVAEAGGLDTPLDQADGVRPGSEVAETVIAQARRCDHRAFTALVSHYDDRLRTLAFHILGDPEATRDALQDAYVKAYVGLPGFRGESSIGTWLHRIVYTTCLNHLRGTSRRPQLADAGTDAQAGRDEAGRDPGDIVASALDLAALLRSLPPEQRAAVVLIDALGMGYRQTGEILGVAQGTVASRVTSARAKLRRALAPREEPATSEDGKEAS